MKSPSKPNITRQSAASQDQDEARKQVIPIVEEEVSISRVKEKTGNAVRVRIESHEEKQQIPVTDIIEEISIERVPIKRYVAERSGPREEGDVVIIPVFETVPVVEQRLLLKEEIRIVRNRREVQREEQVVLRKETPVIEHRASDQDQWSPDFPAQQGR
jgi:stress response protein YsnF